MSPQKTFFARAAAGFLAAMLCHTAVAASGAELGFDPAVIESITGLKGTLNAAEGVFKVASPRKDIPVTVDGWRMPPFMGLTSWAAFKAGGKTEAMVMGDVVLFEDEVNPVMSAALDHGLEVTALHNHFFYDQPKVYFMHIDGDGKVAELATGVKAVFAAIAAERAAHPEPVHQFTAEGLPATSSISAAPLEASFGAKALTSAGMVKFTFGREVTMDCGCTAGKEMGVNTWAAFAGTDDNAVVDGDFVATSAELQAVLKSLRADGINIVAIHNHMTEDTPHMFFLHYWGRGKAADLAVDIKKALDRQRGAGSSRSADETRRASEARNETLAHRSATETTATEIAAAVAATAPKDCGCGACAAKGCKPCRGKNCYYCVAKALMTKECGCGACSPDGCDMCGPGCDVCKFNLGPQKGVAGSK